MVNLIEGIFGRLGKGKTLRSVIKSYSAYCKNRKIYSVLPLNFNHVPVKSLDDFVNMSKGDLLGDELWAIGDNRKRNTMAEIATLICLRSRKQDLNIRYTMQFLQIDVRIAYVTTLWSKPLCLPFDPNPEHEQPTPQILKTEKWDSELKPLPTETIKNISQYFCLYDTKKDPYFVTDMLNDKIIKKIKNELKDSLSEEEYKQYNKIIKTKGVKRF